MEQIKFVDQEVQKLSYLKESYQKTPYLEPHLLFRYLLIDNSVFSSSSRAVSQHQMRQAKELRCDWGKYPHWVRSKDLSGARLWAMIKLNLSCILGIQNLSFSTVSCIHILPCFMMQFWPVPLRRPWSHDPIHASTPVRSGGHKG